MGELQPAVKEEKLIALDHTTKKIHDTIERVKTDFMYIGLLLWEVNNYKSYEVKGYKSVVEYADKEFGFKQASTYNFISICDRFSRKNKGYPTVYLDDKFKDFNFTQLVEIKSLSDDDIKKIDSSMSKREIREKKKELKKNKSEKIIEVKSEKIVEVKFNEDSSKNNIVECQISIDDIETSFDISIIKDFLYERKEVLKELVQNEKKRKSDTYFEFCGALHEVDFFIDFIKENYKY